MGAAEPGSHQALPSEARGVASAFVTYFPTYILPPALGLAALPIMARAMGPAEFGIYGLCLIVHGVLLSLGAEPTTKALTRLYRTPGGTDRGDAFARAVWGLALALASAIALAAILLTLGYVFLADAHRWLWPLVATIVMTLGFTLFQYALTVGYVRERVRATATVQGLHSILKAGALVAGALVFSSAAASLWAYAAVLVPLIGWLHRRELRGETTLIDKASWERSLRYGVPLIGVALSWVVLAGFDRVVLAGFSGERAAGKYALIYLAADFSVSVAAVALRYAVYPSLVRSWESGNLSSVRSLLVGSVDAFLVMSTTVIGVLVVSGSALPTALGGSEFEVPAAVPALVGLGLLLQKMASFESIGFELALTSKRLAGVWLSAAAICVPLTVLAVAVADLTGAAISTVACYGIYWAFVRLRSPVPDVTAYPWSRLIPPLLTMVTLAAIMHQLVQETWLSILVIVLGQPALSLLVLGHVPRLWRGRRSAST